MYSPYILLEGGFKYLRKVMVTLFSICEMDGSLACYAPCVDVAWMAQVVEFAFVPLADFPLFSPFSCPFKKNLILGLGHTKYISPMS
mmetsp:Transcript_23481/g.40514  ORF Transcript_23481/g.40514 Transcript_23481/m.40514 type:complete len:87 (-) Transcript_23481:6566-6826(-)